MKTIFRSLGMGAALAVTLGAAAISGFAQDACSDTAAQDALQGKIRGLYQDKGGKSVLTDPQAAIDNGKQLLEKYGSCEYSKDFVAWLNGQMPRWQDIVDKKRKGDERAKLFGRFDNGIKNKSYDEAYSAGGEIVSQLGNEPGVINQLVPLGLIGLYQSVPSIKNYKYNDQTIRYADMALAKLKAGDPGTKKNAKTGAPEYGVFEFTFSKEDAISELTYAKAYINFWAKGDKKAALPLYYEAIQLPGLHKNDPYAYASIGGYYADEAGRLGKEYAALVQQRKPDNTPEVAAELETKIKNTEGLLKAYLDRAIDAYSRAYNYTKADAKSERDAVYKTVQDLYKLRYQKDTGINEFITATVAKPMPNPTTEVTPVIEADTTTTTGGTGTGVGAANGTGVGAANGTGIGNSAAAKPATTTAAKPVATTAKPVTPNKPRR